MLTAPRLAFARAATNRRLLFVIQRGAADGLSTVAPIGDPAFTPLRGVLAADFSRAQKLDATFALHPALAETGKLYAAKQALFLHAVASPYRDRSHFDGQNVLETGGAQAYALKDGWMNRLLGLLPPEESRALAVAVTVPTALRGTHPVASYAASNLPQASDDLLQRVGMLYSADPQLHPLWQEALQTRAMAGDAGSGPGAAATGTLAASLMAGPQGARVAMIETGGWDTHTGQRGRLAVQLKGLDAMLAAFRTGMGAEWADTLVVVATEFGRTAAINGTGGTDHGTAAAAMLLGGTVAGGRMVTDWPGLAPPQLYENRDLRPTRSLDAAIAGAVAAHFGLDPARTMRTLFPGDNAKPAEGLIVS
ncbi:MAG: DUF1501 domain-containing protein [Novosphingobium sp.]|nr:DUF1501 domain-containing protein [Novosphingobium sp.]